MKTKTHFSVAKLLPVAAVILTIALMLSCSEEKENQSGSRSEAQLSSTPSPSSELQKQEPFTEVDEMPVFPGGDRELLKYIADNTSYPQKAKEAGIQGRVIIRFAVTKTGSVDRVTALKGVSPELDAESIRVVSTLPAFQPGKKDGVPVDVWYMVPITFALRAEK